MQPNDPNQNNNRVPARLPERKVFDVMRPGRAPAPPTSKPVITGHKPEVQDPSVTVSGIGESRPAVPLPPANARRIQVFASGHEPPIEVPNEEAPQEVTPQPVVPPVMPPVETPAPVSVPIPPETGVRNQVVEVIASAPSTGPAAPDMMPEAPAQPAPVAPESPQPADLPAEPTMDTNVELEPEPEQAPQGVFVSEHTPHRPSKLKVIMLIVIILLLGLAIFDILLDAGFVVLKGVPHTTFFSV